MWKANFVCNIPNKRTIWEKDRSRKCLRDKTTCGWTFCSPTSYQGWMIRLRLSRAQFNKTLSIPILLSVKFGKVALIQSGVGALNTCTPNKIWPVCKSVMLRILSETRIYHKRITFTDCELQVEKDLPYWPRP